MAHVSMAGKGHRNRATVTGPTSHASRGERPVSSILGYTQTDRVSLPPQNDADPRKTTTRQHPNAGLARPFTPVPIRP
jgi:hypothetical protein